MAILIDPTARTVTEIEFGGSLQDCYKVMGCDLVDIVHLPHNDMLIVDDEGLLKLNHLFRIAGCPQPLAGKSLLIGDNQEDFMQKAHVTLEEAQRMVQWTDFITNH